MKADLKDKAVLFLISLLILGPLAGASLTNSVDNQKWAATVSVLTVFATGLQTLILLRQTNISSRQTDLIERQVAAAEKQSLLIGLQTDILEQQEHIQRFQYAQMHRPRLVMRRVELVLEAGKPFGVRYLLKNVGGMETTVVQCVLELGIARIGTPAVSQRITKGESFSVPAGVNIPGDCQFSAITRMSEDYVASDQIIFAGWITYKSRTMDSEFRTITYQLGFARHYDGKAGCFRIIDNPELEYSD